MDVYFAHPYSSFERGTNENTNGIIRRFFSKGTRFSGVSESEVKAVQDWVNTYPRRILSGKTSLEMFKQLFPCIDTQGSGSPPGLLEVTNYA